jgi:prepilin-type processing-associated H-X9-DG protein
MMMASSPLRSMTTQSGSSSSQVRFLAMQGVRQDSARRGLTVIELLLALSVVTVLLALLGPAIQTMRESSRLLTCQSRLRQIGVAIHGFESTHGGLPPIARPLNGRRDRSIDKASPHVALLPWLEQATLSTQLLRYQPLPMALDMSSVTDKPLRQLVTTQIPGFRCPSDSGPGINNFVFCLGADAVAKFDEHSRFWGNGPFPLIASLPVANIRDGLSNTAAVSERLTGSQNSASFDSTRDFWYAGVEQLLDGQNAWPVTNAALMSICRQSRPAAPHLNTTFGWSWAYGRYEATCYNHVVPPNSPYHNCATMSAPEIIRAAPHGIFRATSNHAGGVNQLMLDGSVRFVSDAVDQSVYRAIATRGGSEPVAATEF